MPSWIWGLFFVTWERLKDVDASQSNEAEYFGDGNCNITGIIPLTFTKVHRNTRWKSCLGEHPGGQPAFVKHFGGQV
jgi:hypothetical protein